MLIASKLRVTIPELQLVLQEGVPRISSILFFGTQLYSCIYGSRFKFWLSIQHFNQFSDPKYFNLDHNQKLVVAKTVGNGTVCSVLSF